MQLSNYEGIRHGYLWNNISGLSEALFAVLSMVLRIQLNIVSAVSELCLRLL